jgi:hypothetical protein
MRNAGVVLASLIAGFFGAAIAITMWGGVHASANDKISSLDTLTATHIIVTGDIKVQSKEIQPLEFTNGDGAYMRIDNNSGTSAPDGTKSSGNFLVEIGSDRVPPGVIISPQGLAVRFLQNKIDYLAQLSAWNGLQLSYQDQSGIYPVTSKLRANGLDLSSADGSPTQTSASLSFSGLACRANHQSVKCP